MTLLLPAAALEERRAAARGALAPLADSLADDLEPVLAAPLFVPREKARLSRAGGRCPRDGTALDFDPFSPRSHRCPRCDARYDDEAHYRYWLMWYQLWLAERSTHAAALYALRGDERHRAFAGQVLQEYADGYARYPDRDNVLGPSRLFFSTYLESLWLLQLCATLDLLEAGAATGVAPGAAALGAEVRDRLVTPAAALIAQYDEGTSNRQAWNCAAQLAAARLLGDSARFDGVVARQLVPLLSTALLADGSWYEGENYHVFAHRGLWYGVTMAEVAGRPLPEPLTARFDAGFAIPFLTALPDMTMLARRDSQYAISLRQWRFAELCELGLARRENPVLRGALDQLYGGIGMSRETGRARSPGEAERHAPPAALSRASLGWRSLLHATPALGALPGRSPGSVLLAHQGLAVLRRAQGRVMIALDYGESGGGHGHPDRLNLVCSDGPTRWLDDPGTGSYVDRSLHWYRSTLAHCAPLAGRRSQRRVSGRLLAFEERGAAGWAAAAVDDLAPGVHAERRVVVMPDYLVDELAWTAPDAARFALPLHVDGSFEDLEFHAESLVGAGGLEDGFDFVTSAECTTPHRWPLRLRARSVAGTHADVWLHAPDETVLWRLRAPGPPGSPERTFHLLESSHHRGAFTTVLAWTAGVAGVQARDGSLVLTQADGSVHEHTGSAASWRVDMRTGSARSSIDLGGAMRGGPGTPARSAAPRAIARTPLRLVRASRGGGREARFELGERDYRRSEQSWTDAGSPRALVHLELRDDALAIAVESLTGSPVFVADDAVNDMDNEQPDVNASGVQLHLETGGIVMGWLLRPAPEGAVRVRSLTPASPPLPAAWERTAQGWRLRATIPLALFGPATPYALSLGVIVNEIPPGRERRRGQLVLGGAEGEWVYLRGDRHDPSRFVPIIID